MGKGSNVQKANQARARAQARKDEEGKGGGGKEGMAARTGANSVKVKCKICLVSCHHFFFFYSQESRRSIK